MKVSLSLVGNYMCKNPPVVIFDITGLHNDKDLIKKYIFNTPADIQRNLQSQFVRLNGSQTIMFTKFSHDVLTGLVDLILTLYDNQKKLRTLFFKIYGTQKHFAYFQMAKYHLGAKILGISYCAWLTKFYRLGIIDNDLHQEILKSDKFSSYIWKINWRLEKQAKQKINNSCDYLSAQGQYYEDQFALIKPFFDVNPKFEKDQYYNSITHYLCFFKSKNPQDSKPFSKSTLIITYQSIQKLNKIISRKDKVKGINGSLGLLDFIEKNLKEHSTGLSTILHIVQDHQLLNHPQFHQLYTILDNICYSLNSQDLNINVSHLFYGYGIKTSTTNIHHLLNTYYKGVRFYSICSKLFKFFPNITLNHFTFWNKMFEKDFINIVDRIQENNERKNKSFIQVYKPIHKMKIYETSNNEISCEINKTVQQPYQISSSILQSLKYPLFSTAAQYRLTDQLTKIYEKRAAIQGFTNSKKNKKIYMDEKIKLLKQFDPKIIFLGTNSKTPSELRNVSGILLQLPIQTVSQTLILLDCGSGTYQQFMYHFSPEELPQKLINLKIVFMTHLHADHNLGILNLIAQRINLIKQKNLSLQQNKMFIILPFNMFGWINNYCTNVTNLYEGCQILFTQTLIGEKINVRDQFFESRCGINQDRIKLSPGKIFGPKNQQYKHTNYYRKYIQRDSSLQDIFLNLSWDDGQYLPSLLQKHRFQQQYIKNSFLQLLQKQKIKKFLPSKVFHCPFSYGIVIQHNNGIKISYSGDCRPTPQFLEQAKNSMLLIHEATYESNCQQKAQFKLHSTFHEALQAGLISKSQNVCVTHFTPALFNRDYAQQFHHSLYKPEVLDYYKKKSIIACDHLEFKLSEMDDIVKVSKIVCHIGTNNVTEKNPNPFSIKSIIQQRLKDSQ